MTTENGVNDDPDRDGLSNLEEYFAESDPSDPAISLTGLQFEIPEAGTHRLTVRESLDLSGRGLSAVVESSPDLMTWSIVGDLVEESSERLNPEGVRVRELERDGVGQGPLFYRLRVTLAP